MRQERGTEATGEGRTERSEVRPSRWQTSDAGLRFDPCVERPGCCVSRARAFAASCRRACFRSHVPPPEAFRQQEDEGVPGSVITPAASGAGYLAKNSSKRSLGEGRAKRGHRDDRQATLNHRTIHASRDGAVTTAGHARSLLHEKLAFGRNTPAGQVEISR